MNFKRVLVLAEYGFRNGSENSWLAIADRLQEFGWQAIVATPRDTEFFDHASHCFETIDLNLFDEHHRRKSQTSIRAELATLIRSTRPDLVHGNSLSTTRLAGPVTAKLNVPSLGYLRDILKLSRQAIDDINQADRIVAVSQATGDFHIAQGLDPSKCSIVYNGVDLSRFKPGNPTRSLHRELNISDESRLITCIGQIGMRKATDVVIRSFVELTRFDPSLHLILVGQRHSQKQEAVEYERLCHQIAPEFGLNHRVHWLGRRNDVRDILRESTLLLHGSRQEPLGRVLIEAAACGCPFIATRVGGTPEIVRGLESLNLMCDAGSPEAMARAARKLLCSPVNLSFVSRQLREMAVDRFDAIRCAEQVHALYRELIGE